ncbi:MAG TPA: hypothetical protein VM051_13140 [Usitatibacter sp.]|nr:hypothetical protein [Usitatibacter sp.]
MTPRLRSCIAVVALVATCAATFASAQQRRTEELMRKSGLWDQVAQMRQQMKAGIQEARREAKASNMPLLDDASYAKLSGAIDRAFASDVLRESVALHLEEFIAPRDEVEVLGWLSSDVGARFTRMEIAAGDISESANVQEQGPKLLASVSKPRLEKYQRLAAALDAGDTTAGLTINMTSVIVYGIALVMPGTDADMAAKAIRQRMQGQRAKMAEYFGDKALQSYAYAYRAATDAQLDSYVKFAESAAARRYHSAGIRAMDATLSQAALAMGQELGSRP